MFVTYFIQLTTINTTSEYFQVYSNVSGLPISPVVSKATLAVGIFVQVPYNANLITVKAINNCQYQANILITPGTTTTTTTTTTTLSPDCLLEITVNQI